MTARRLVTAVLREDLGLLVVYGLLVALAVAVSVAAPRALSAAADDGVRVAVATTDDQGRTLTVEQASGYRVFHGPAQSPESLAATSEELLDAMRPELRDVLGDVAYSAQAQPREITDLRTGERPDPRSHQLLGLRMQSDYDGRVTWVAGEAPRAAPIEKIDGTSQPVFDVAVSEQVAEAMHLDVGRELRLQVGYAEQPLSVRVTGIFRADPPDPRFWAGEPRVLVPDVQAGDVVIITGFGLIAADELLPLGRQLSQTLATAWRFPVDAQALDSDSVDEVVEAVGAFRSAAALLPSAFGGFRASSTLADTVERFHDQQRATAGVRTVATVGLLAVALATIGLVGWLVVARRERTLALLRARGARVSTVLGVVLLESLLVAAPAAVLGAALALLVVPARPLRGPALVGLAVLVLALALPVAYAYRRHRGVSGSHQHAQRGGPHRTTLEIVVLVVAVGGSLLLLRDPAAASSPATGVLRAAAPLLLAVTIGLAAQRLLALAVRPLRRRATKSRSIVALLAAAGAARSAAAYTLPVLVVVVAVATTVFVGTVRTAVTSGQVEAAWQAVGAPAQLDAVRPGQAAAVADLPGVCGVAAARAVSGTLVTSSRATKGTSVLILDVPAYLTVVAGSPLGLDGLAALLAPAASDGSVRVLAARTPAPTSVTLGPTTVRTTVAGTVPPALDTGSGPLVVVPMAAWPDRADTADRLYLCDDGVDPTALRAAAPGASLQTLASVVAAAVAPPLVGSTMSWLVVTAVLTAAFALLAVFLALLATRPQRRREQSLLRTLGLTRREGRRLGYATVAPPLTVGVGAGLLAGLGICWLTLHWLDLGAMGAGPAPSAVPPWPLLVTIVAAAALVLAGAVMLEDVLGRARRPDEELRGGVRK